MKHDLAALALKARFFPLPSGGIVYLGQQKKLYGLNAPAALIWQDLAEDHPPIETLHRLKIFRLMRILPSNGESWPFLPSRRQS